MYLQKWMKYIYAYEHKRQLVPIFSFKYVTPYRIVAEIKV